MKHFQHIDDQTITTLTDELNAFEKNPINGWDSTYPTLYACTLSAVETACTRLNTSVPDIFLAFTPPQSFQCMAHIMAAGKNQIYIGTEFIRTFLLHSPEDATLQKAFYWTIAHEIGHLSDSAMNLFGRYHKLRLFLDQIGFIWTVGLTSSITFKYLGHILFDWPVMHMQGLVIALLAGLGFVGIKACIMIALYRKFEYNADRISLDAIDAFDAQVIKQALGKMTAAITAHVAQTKSNNILKRLLGALHARYVVMYHPSITARIERMQK